MRLLLCVRRVLAILIVGVGSAVFASTGNGLFTHETVTLADLLSSQGTGATEIPSYGAYGDAGNTTITHTLAGDYHANIVLVSGTIRAEVANGNWFRDANLAIITSGGSEIFTFASAGVEVQSVGEVDVFVEVPSPLFGIPNPDGGQQILAGPASFQFYESGGFDEALNAPDNVFTDLTIEFAEIFTDDGNFNLGALTSGTPFVDDTMSHSPGGLDFFDFTLPAAGTLDISTDGSENGVNGFSLDDTEIGLFDATGKLIAQNDDIGGVDDVIFSELLGLSLPAGNYTLVTTTFNSSLNDTLSVGDDISLATAGSDFGDYAVTLSFTESTTTTAPCDFDADGDCDTDDIDALYANFGSAAAVATYDLDGSSAVDAGDIAPWLTGASDPSNPFNANAKAFLLGDVDFDGDVDSVDLGRLLNNFNDDTGLLYGDGNLDGDAVVASLDLGLLLNNFNFTSASVNAVPEPDMGWVVFGLLMLTILCRRHGRPDQAGVV